MPLKLIALSYNHLNADVVLRDQLALDNDESQTLIEAALSSDKNIRELLTLSTCNRTEIYALATESTCLFDWFSGQIKSLKNLDLHKNAPEPTILYDQEAVEHLMEVAGGLKSMMLGENQILSQVKSSHSLLRKGRYKFPFMNRLLQDAIRAGKAVRTNTELCRGAVSISLAAVELSKKIYTNFVKRKVMLVGAGETNELVAVHYAEMGVTNFIVANRSKQRREKLAAKFNAHPISLDEIPGALSDVDIIITATKSTTYLLDQQMLVEVLKSRHYQPILIIDIGTPRNVDPEIAGLPEVYLYNIDNLADIVAENLDKRKKEIPAAEQIVRNVAREFMEWYRSLEVVPTIAKLNTYFNAIRDQELKKFVNKTSDKTYVQMEELSRSLVRKLLHYPIASLREASNNGNHDLLRIDTIWEIFRLHDLEKE